jgi:hypothetical protein
LPIQILEPITPDPLSVITLLFSILLNLHMLVEQAGLVAERMDWTLLAPRVIIMSRDDTVASVMSPATNKSWLCVPRILVSQSPPKLFSKIANIHRAAAYQEFT